MSRRDRERRARRDQEWKEARKTDSSVSLPAKASRYIHYLTALVKAGLVQRVVLYCRVSTEAQEQAGNGEDQEDDLRRKIERLGILVLRAFHDTHKGHDLNRRALKKAIAYALKHDAILVAESTDRFLRPAGYHTQRQAPPTTEQFEELARMCRGVTLATLCDPDAPPSYVQLHQSKRGQWPDNSGGRPETKRPGYKKDHRDKELPNVLRMRAAGMSIRRIADETKTPKSTVLSWIADHADRLSHFSPDPATRRAEKRHANPGKTANRPPPRPGRNP